MMNISKWRKISMIWTEFLLAIVLKDHGDHLNPDLCHLHQGLILQDDGDSSQ